jgi:hypothetical protein
MSTLTDRYVWGVLRAVPERQRAELEPEIRALIADAIEARGPVDSGASGERAALAELGDPEILAARYTDRSLYLIGPSHYLDYRRLLTLLLVIVVPTVTLALLFAGFIAEAPAGEAAANAVSAGFNVGIQLAFWVTVVFVLVERRGTRTTPFVAWSPDRLPQVPSAGRLGARDAVASVVGSVVVIGVILWQPPFIVQGHAVPFFDPALWSTWFPWFLAIAVARIAFTIALYAAGRWTWATATVNAALGAAAAIPLAWLLQANLVLSPDAIAEMQRVGAGASLAPTSAVIAIAVLGVTALDAVDGFRKAGRAPRAGG